MDGIICIITPNGYHWTNFGYSRKLNPRLRIALSSELEIPTRLVQISESSEIYEISENCKKFGNTWKDLGVLKMRIVDVKTVHKERILSSMKQSSFPININKILEKDLDFSGMNVTNVSDPKIESITGE